MARSKQKVGPNWAFKVYPDSVSLRTLLDYLANTHLKWAVSPLHDCDVYDSASVAKWLRHNPDAPESERPSVGDPIDPHFHVILAHPGNTTYSAVLDRLSFLLKDVGPNAGSPAVSYVERIDSLPGYTRYLAHLDDPQKSLYDVGNILSGGGFDLSPLDGTKKSEKSRTALTKAIMIIRHEGFRNFCDVVDYSLNQDDMELFDVLAGRSAFVGMYLTSHAQKLTAINTAKGLVQ